MSNRILTFKEWNDYCTTLFQRNYGPFYGYWGS